jgi:hypothetical protein
MLTDVEGCFEITIGVEDVGTVIEVLRIKGCEDSSFSVFKRFPPILAPVTAGPEMGFLLLSNYDPVSNA